MVNKIKEVDIVKLEYPDNIRTRQGMYGSDGTDATILFREVVDNTIDLATKFKLSINVESWINQNDWNVVVDNGLGFPIYKDMDFPNEDRSIVRDMMCKVNVGSNFNQTQYSTGQNGVGTRLTQALSDDFILLSNANKKDKKTLPKFIQEGLDKSKSIYIWHSKKGRYYYESVLNKQELVSYLKDLINKDLTKNLSEFLDSFNEDDFGTMVLFKPDSTLLESTKVNYKGYPFSLVKELFKYDTDFSNINLTYKLNGKEIQPYSFTSDFKEKLIEDKVLTLSSSIKTEDVLPIKFICQFAWCSDKFNVEVNGSVNLLETPVGKHLNIVQNAIGQALVKYNPLLKSNDARYGLRLFVLNLALKPLFNSQDKTKLSKWEDKGYNEKEVIKTLADSFLKLMKENSEYFDLLCERIIEYKRATEKLSNIELLKSKIVMGDESDKKRIMSGQMSDVYECTSDDFSKRELYIVEGKSAMGGILQSRNKLFQAVIPLRGKLLNTSTLDEERLVDNKEVLAIINTIGCGLGGICDPSKSRYNKVIIASDFDSDGSFTPDTLIPLLDGRVVPIFELAKEKEFWVYSCDNNGNIVPGRGHSARITKSVSKLYYITLDNGEVIKCSDNHPFLMRNGESYVRADELKVGDHLMPLYLGKDKDDYPTVKSNFDNKFKPVHRVVKEYFLNLEGKHLEKGYHVHHIDRNINNNAPNNLMYLTKKDHMALHAKEDGNYLTNTYNKLGVHSKLISEYHKNGLYEGTSYFIDYNKTEKHSEVVKARNDRMWNSKEIYKDGLTYKQYMRKAQSDYMKVPENRDKHSAKTKEQWQSKDMQFRMRFSRIVSVVVNCIEEFGKCDNETYTKLKPRSGVDNYFTAIDKYCEGKENDFLISVKAFIDLYPNKVDGKEKAKKFFETFNHTITNIEIVELEEDIDLWDFTVDIWENFALASGVFVHNSHIANLITTLFLHHAPEMIKQGYLYKVEAPYYKVIDGKKVKYYYHDEKDKIDFSKEVHKLKGLGSYTKEEAKQFLMDTKERRLIPIVWNPDMEYEIQEASKLMYSGLARKKLMIERGIFNQEDIL